MGLIKLGTYPISFLNIKEDLRLARERKRLAKPTNTTTTNNNNNNNNNNDSDPNDMPLSPLSNPIPTNDSPQSTPTKPPRTSLKTLLTHLPLRHRRRRAAPPTPRIRTDLNAGKPNEMQAWIRQHLAEGEDPQNDPYPRRSPSQMAAAEQAAATGAQESAPCGFVEVEVEGEGGTDGSGVGVGVSSAAGGGGEARGRVRRLGVEEGVVMVLEEGNVVGRRARAAHMWPRGMARTI